MADHRPSPARPGRPPLSEPERSAMLDAFIAAIASRGYEGLTLRSVALETGMSPARLSYHFGTKKKLFIAALALVEDRASAGVQGSMKGASSHWQRVSKVISWSLPDGVGDPEWQIWLAAFDQAPYDPEIAAVLALSSKRYKRQLADAIQAGADAGEFVVRSALETATVASATLDGLAIECVAGVPGMTRTRVRALVLGLLRRELGLASD